MSDRDPHLGEWGKLLFDASATQMVRDYKRGLILIQEIERTMPPRPPLSRYQKLRNRTRWWLNENVNWRFARRRPEEWD